MSAHHTDSEGLKLNAAERAVLIETLGMRDQSNPESNIMYRKEVRYRPYKSEVLATVEHPGGSRVDCQTIVYNLSKTGIGVATRVYLHKNTPISLFLWTYDGEEVSIHGRVMWCEYHENGIHRTGVAFDSPIDPRNYVDPEIWLQNLPDEAETMWTKKRVALHVDEDLMEVNTVSMLVKNMNFECTGVESIGGALDLVQKNLYDLVLLSDAITDMSITDSVNALRASSYNGPVVVITASKQGREEMYSGLGISALLRRPVQLSPMIAAFRDVYENGKTMTGTERIYSSLREEQCSVAQLEEFLGMVSRCCKHLESCMVSNEYQTAIKICSSLHASGAGYGYSELSALALEVIQALNASCSVHESAVSVRSLIRLIGRLSSRESADPKKKNAA